VPEIGRLRVINRNAIAFAVAWALLIVVVVGILSAQGVAPAYVIGLALLPLVPWRLPRLSRKHIVLGSVVLLLGTLVATAFLGSPVYMLRPPDEVSLRIEGTFDELAGTWALNEFVTLARDDFGSDSWMQLVINDLEKDGWSQATASQEAIVLTRARTLQFASPDLMPTAFVFHLELGAELSHTLRLDAASRARLRLPAGLAMTTLPTARTKLSLPGNLEQLEIALDGLRGDDSVSVEMGGSIFRNPILALILRSAQGLGGQLFTGLLTLVVALLKDRIWQTGRDTLTRLRGRRHRASRAKPSHP